MALTRRLKQPFDQSRRHGTRSRTSLSESLDDGFLAAVACAMTSFTCRHMQSFVELPCWLLGCCWAGVAFSDSSYGLGGSACR